MSDELVKHSIFKINVYKRTYEFAIDRLSNIFGVLSYITSVVHEDTFVEYKDFATIDLSMPLLKIGDVFYFEKETKKVTIREVIRTDEGNMVYIVDDEIIEDDESYKKAKEKEEKWHEYNNNNNENRKMRDKLDKIKSHWAYKLFIKHKI